MTDLTHPKTTASGGFFITGTDTDVGKTYITACLAFTLSQRNFTVIPRKPIASGCIKQPDGRLYCEDAELVKKAANSSEAIEDICPYQFEPPISPQIAIKQAGLSISTEDLLNRCGLPYSPQDNEYLLVEGAGGFYSPLCSDGLNRDLAMRLQLPVILVVKNQLGCINHTLLTLEAIKSAGLHTHAIFINDVNANKESKNHAEGLESWTDRPIYRIPYSDQSTPINLVEFEP